MTKRHRRWDDDEAMDPLPNQSRRNRMTLLQKLTAIVDAFNQIITLKAQVQSELTDLDNFLDNV